MGIQKWASLMTRVPGSKRRFADFIPVKTGAEKMARSSSALNGRRDFTPFAFLTLGKRTSSAGLIEMYPC